MTCSYTEREKRRELWRGGGGGGGGGGGEKGRDKG